MRNRNHSKVAALANLVAFAAIGWGQANPAPPPNEKQAGAEGEVRNAIDGLPIERVHVSLEKFGDGGMDRYGALTNAEGRFAILNIPEGNYNLVLERVGFVDLNGPSTRMMMLMLRAGDKREVMKLKLTPTGAITGRVLDGDGKPVEHVMVGAENGNRRDRSGVTDDRGIYRIGGLRPGKYRVRAAPQEMPVPPEIRTDTTVEEHYSATYHPDALDAKSATRVLVGAGTDVPGVDIHLVRTPIVHISGRVAGLPAGAQNGSVMLRALGTPTGSGGSQIRPDGSFEIWRPTPGKYSIEAHYYNSGGQLSSAPVEIEVGAADVENIALQLMAPEEIRGQVDFLDEEARNPPAPDRQTVGPGGQPMGQGSMPQQPPRRRVLLRNADGGQMVMPADLGDGGVFTLQKVPPGKYRLALTGSPVYVKSIQLGQTTMDGAVLDLRNGSGGAGLGVRVASATGVVQGTVSDEKGPVARARVVLGEETAYRGNPMFAISKDDGSYTFTAVAPGKYKIQVVDEAESIAIVQGNAEDSEDLGESLEVAEHQTVNKDLKRK